MTRLDELFGAALVVPAAIDDARAAAARQRCEARGYTRYTLVDRGSYDVQVDADEPELFALMIGAAQRATGRSLVVSESRVIRLVAGDYLLAHHDRIYDDNPVEVTLDLSPVAVPDAEVHYRRRGQVFFRFECTPGALAIVERGATITCNHTYVSKLHRYAAVVRLIVLLRDR
ncbi:MAG TPA: hypothetical protein VIV40_34700 [Kofleriaceae bacterium]